MGRKKKETQVVAQIHVQGPLNPVDTSSPVYWRDLVAQKLAQFNKHDTLTLMQQHECSALVEVAASAIIKQFGTISRKCAQNDSLTVKASMALALDRSGGASTDVSAHLSASEKWVDCNEQTQVCSPDQELALFAEGTEAAAVEAPTEESSGDGAEAQDGEEETA